MGVVGGATSIINTDTFLDNDYLVYIIDATTNNINVTLPDYSDVGNIYFKLKRQDTNTTNTVTISSVTYSPTGTSPTQTIDSNPTLSMNPGDKYEVVLFNGLWYTI